MASFWNLRVAGVISRLQQKNDQQEMPGQASIVGNKFKDGVAVVTRVILSCPAMPH